MKHDPPYAGFQQISKLPVCLIIPMVANVYRVKSCLDRGVQLPGRNRIGLGDAMKAVRLALSKPNLQLCGIHCHIGSQIFDSDPFEHTAEIMLHFLDEVRKETGVLT
mgnify:CR=1 FL=1